MAQMEQKAPASTGSVSLQSKEQMERVFRRFDANGDGKISSSELEQVLRALGSDVSADELARMMDEMDSDKDGFVDLSEFEEFHVSGRAASGRRDMEELKEAFDMYDLDRDGKITVEELHKVLAMLGEGCSVNDCSKMIGGVDADDDGTVGFDEFKSMMTNK